MQNPNLISSNNAYKASSRFFKYELHNTFLIIEIATLFIGTIFKIIQYDYEFAVIMFVFAIVSSICYLLNRRQKHDIALHTNLISTNLFLFYACIYMGQKSGVYLMYFPILVGYSFILDFDKKKELISYVVFSSFLLLTSIINEEVYTFVAISHSAYTQLQYNIFVFIAFGMVGYGSFLAMWLRFKQKSELMSQIQVQLISEKRVNQALKDKEVLLAEVYHRVKNNLTVVTSLINLQMNTIENEYTKSVLLDCKNRIASMSMIHQKFYQGKNYSSMDFKSYIKELVDEIKSAYNITEKNIDVNLRVDKEISFSLNTAIPCGIILNELISNAFKHAFNEKESGVINVSLHKDEKLYLLRVQDDGKGFNFQNELDKANSLGLILIESLTDQLEGNFQYYGNVGTDFRLIFNADATKPL